MKSKRYGRILAMIISLVMCICSMTQGVFAGSMPSGSAAEAATTTKLLVLGDSTSSGYGLPDFVNHNCGFNVKNNYLDTTWTVAEAQKNIGGGGGRISSSSYPWQLKKYIEKTEGVKCDLSAMCLNGMRTDELRALLDDEYYKKILKQEAELVKTDDGNGFLTDHIDSFWEALEDGGALVSGTNGSMRPVSSVSDAQMYTREEVKNADVIVVDCCMNNFGTYLAERIAGYAGLPGYGRAANYYKQTVDDLDGVPAGVKTLISQVKTMLKQQGLLNDGTAAVEEFANSFLYCYADFATNLTADINTIRELNPDARIIVCGVYDALDGINLEVGDNTVDFGRISSRAFDLVNLYIKALSSNRAEYYYADLSDGVETFMMQIEAADKYTDLDTSLQDNLYNSFKDMFLGGADIGYKERILQMLVDAADYNTLDLEGLMKALAKGTGALTNEISVYITDESGEAKLSDETWMMLQIVDRFMLYMGIGQHPSSKGVEQKWQAVRTAYDSYSPEYEALKDVVKDVIELRGLVRTARETGNADDIKLAADKLKSIRTYIRSIRKNKVDEIRLALLNKSVDEIVSDTVEMIRSRIAEIRKKVSSFRTLEEAEAALAEINTLSSAAASLPADDKTAGSLKSELNNASVEIRAKAAKLDDKEKAEDPGDSKSGIGVPSVRSVKAKASGKAFTVSWKKLSAAQQKNVTKIQIQYSTSKKFKQYRTVLASKGSSSKNITGLKKGKTYYVRVRSIKYSNDKQTASKWSAVKTVRVK